jgi:hypothetical protein
MRPGIAWALSFSRHEPAGKAREMTSRPVLHGICLCALLLQSRSQFAADMDSALRVRSTVDPARIEVIAAIPAKGLEQIPHGKLAQEQGERWLRFSLLDKENPKAETPIFGTYERRDGGLFFTPRYPLARGQRYRAIWEPVKGEITSVEYAVPLRPHTPPAVVEKIFPSAPVLPANQLKFYIHFSKPMRETSAIFEQIHLLDEDGKEVDDPWRRTELWTADGRRLTLWVHPGRVKRGVNLREEIGTVMQPNREYRLVIGAEVLDAEGQPLGKTSTKKFRTTDEQRSRISIEQWKIQAPTVDTEQVLFLEFPRPLDRALLERYVTVLDAKGKTVPGRIVVGPEERSWSFHPNQGWKATDYRIVVNERLEDLAGNTPLRVFDVDLTEPAPDSPKLTLNFRPKSKEPGSR